MIKYSLLPSIVNNENVYEKIVFDKYSLVVFNLQLSIFKLFGSKSSVIEFWVPELNKYSLLLLSFFKEINIFLDS